MSKESNMNAKVEIEEVKIGKQVWSSKNVVVVQFRNGDEVPLAKNEKEWKKAVKEEKPMMCYNFFEKSGEALYNWYAINDNRGLAPEGWHVPSDEECAVLIEQCGGEENGGHALKDTKGWDEFMDDDLNTQDGNGSNTSGFAALPVGMCTEDGEFFGGGTQMHFWTSTDYVKSSAIDFRLFEDRTTAESKASEKGNGYSLRLIKD
jgi:uncharacterized protein (TIGR02145 family)